VSCACGVCDGVSVSAPGVLLPVSVGLDFLVDVFVFVFLFLVPFLCLVELFCVWSCLRWTRILLSATSGEKLRRGLALITKIPGVE
jgi:hypothetical protein